MLLTLPTPQTSDGFGPKTPEALAADPHHPSNLRERVLDLLPTPRASDGPKGSPNQHGNRGDLMLAPAVLNLLPTPTTEPTTGNGHARNLGNEVRLLPTTTTSRSGGATPAGRTLTDAVVREQMGTMPNPRWRGDRTDRPSDDGSDSPELPLPPPT